MIAGPLKLVQWTLALLSIAGVLTAAALHHWPFITGLNASKYQHPTLWQLLIADRFTLGLLRLALVVLGLYVIISVPALVAGSRWVKGFGKEGLTADDAQTVNKTIDSLKNELDEVTQKFEDATNQIATLTDERDEARALARQAIP